MFSKVVLFVTIVLVAGGIRESAAARPRLGAKIIALKTLMHSLTTDTAANKQCYAECAPTWMDMEAAAKGDTEKMAKSIAEHAGEACSTDGPVFAECAQAKCPNSKGARLMQRLPNRLKQHCRETSRR